MTNPRGNIEKPSGLEHDGGCIHEIDFQLAFQNQKALVRAGVPVPAVFAAHDSEPDAVSVDLHEREVAIALAHASGELFEVDLGESRECGSSTHAAKAYRRVAGQVLADVPEKSAPIAILLRSKSAHERNLP